MVRAVVIMGVLVGLSGCDLPPVTVKSVEQGGDLVRVTVKNRTDQDVRSLHLEVRFESATGELLRTDTIRYSGARGPGGSPSVTIEAGGETFINSRVPDAAAEASSRITYVTLSDGTSWRRSN